MKPAKKNGQWKNTNPSSLLTLKKCHSDPSSHAKFLRIWSIPSLKLKLKYTCLGLKIK